MAKTRDDSPIYTRHHPHKFNQLALKRKALKSKDWYRVSVSQPPSKNLMYTYNSPGYARVQGSERADSLAEKATKTSDLCLGSSEVLRTTRHYLRVQSLKDTTLSIVCQPVWPSGKALGL